MISTIIPVAGLGTRCLPMSKAIPKEMFPVFDRPIIQHIVEEAVHSGSRQIIFVTSQGKTAIEDHFDISPSLEASLKKAGKKDLYERIFTLSRMIEVETVRQKEPKGLGHAVWMAKSLIHSSPFAVILGDDMVDADPPGLKQLIHFYEHENLAKKDAGVVMLMEVEEADVSKYGICDMASSKSHLVRRCIEKPKSNETSSRLAIIGRYLLPQEILDRLGQQKSGAIGEIQLTDALNELSQEARLYGLVLKGLRFDAGDPLGFLHANLHYYLKSNYKAQVIKMIEEQSGLRSKKLL